MFKKLSQQPVQRSAMPLHMIIRKAIIAAALLLFVALAAGASAQWQSFINYSGLRHAAPGDSLKDQSPERYKTEGSLMAASLSSFMQPAPPSRINYALASQGSTATASSVYSTDYNAGGAINGDRVNVSAGNYWNDASPANNFPDWLEINFNANRSIDEINVISVQDNYQAQLEPTETMTFSTYGLTGFDVQYWTGSAWVNVTGGQITGNNLVWRKITFSPVTTQKIRVVINATADGWSRVVELEAWGDDATATSGTNVALASNGGVASASSVYGAGYEASSTINGDRKGTGWGSGGGWNGNAPGNPSNDWLQVTFNGLKTIHEIDLFTIQDNTSNPSTPNESMTFNTYGLTGFDVQYWNGTSWVNVPGGQITGNNKVWTKITFSHINTTKIRVLAKNSPDGYGRIIELEAWGQAAAPGINVALSQNGGVASTSSNYSADYSGAGAINGDRMNTGAGQYWNDAAPANAFPDWLEVTFNGQKTIHEVDVFMVQDSPQTPVDPTPTTTFSLYGLTDFKVQYWTGSAWADIPGASVTGNNLVWRRFNFSEITTQKIRVWCTASADGWSRIVEVEAYQATMGEMLPAPTSLSAIPASSNQVNLSWVDNSTNETGFKIERKVGANGTYAEVATVGANVNSYTNGSLVSETQYYYRVRATNGSINSDYSNEAIATTSGSSQASFNAARLDPDNETGQAGENLLSRNFNWSLPVVGLPGRAGLDLGLSLTYNSLVWTTDLTGLMLKYDADQGFPSPGFRLGFPVIEPKYVSSQTGKNSYLMVMPSGSRVELRQVGTSGVYEAADSSYLQLTEGSGLTLHTTSGTKLSYTWQGVNFQCTEIKDRNGNFITIAYENGRIKTITDTVGRIISFNYDSSNRLSSITQQWKPGTQTVTHKWAEFTYENQTIQTGLSQIIVLGPQDGSQVSLLKKVKLADGSSYEFTYNGWGQVYQIKSLAADGHELARTTYTMDNPMADCPRINKRRDYAENWNNGQEVTTSFSVTANTTWTMPDDNAQHEGKVCAVRGPDNTTTKVYYHATGWDEGLPLLSETITDEATNPVRQRWVRMKWTQDNESVAYRQNPRVTENIIGDPAGNLKRTIVTYQNFTLPDNSSCYLPVDVAEGNATTVLRHTKTSYNLDAAYTSLRIIGLTDTARVFEGDGESDAALRSKVSYTYDESGHLFNQSGVIQHDDVNYDVNSDFKRANLTSIKRWDVEHPSDSTYAVVFRTFYNTTGSAITIKDPLNHSTIISYTDAYSSGNVAANTFAYPTASTDAGGNSSTFTYSYDTGAITKTRNALGAEVVSQFDSIGRLTQRTLRDGVANQNITHTRLEYSASMTELRTYTLLDVVGGNNVESLSLQRFDGAGRVIGVAANHPGSNGQFSGQKMQFDVMGQLTAQTNPAEISDPINPTSVPVANWQVTGDDAAAGWKWTQIAYDWKGRPVLTTNVDGTTQEIAYGGCGCAGGDVVLTRDEIGRRQKVTYDVLGRVKKAESLFEQAKNVPLDDSGNVYSATVNTYNALNQLTNVRQYAGPDTSSTYQDVIMTYDGHARLKTRHVPAQDVGKATAYTYNADDQIATVTDARGVVTNYGYNSRHLLTNISYTVPQEVTVKPSPGVTFTYNAVGNRESMTERDAQNNVVGSTTYSYDNLSRLQSETRQFGGLSGNFTLSYTYSLSGQLKSITDPFNSTINYAYDGAGRLTSVTGTSFGGTTQYATGAQYRAWGALKSLSYGNTKTLSINYDQRLLPTSYEVPGVLKKTYEYYNDGRQKKINDLLITDSNYDRAYSYDHMGRITEALSGVEARGGTSTTGMDRIYKETFQYDALGHLTGRLTHHWNQAYSSTDVFQNDRRTGAGWAYDADGRMLWSPELGYSYDAAGLLVAFGDFGASKTEQQFDGDGLVVRAEKMSHNDQTSVWQTEKLVYNVNSSVLDGATVTEVSGTGGKLRTLVYAGGQVLAWQMKEQGNIPDHVLWEHRDSSGASFRMTNSSGQALPHGGGWSEYLTLAEYDPAGADTSMPAVTTLPEPQEQGNGGSLLGYPGAGIPSFFRTTYTFNGIPVDADFAMMQQSMGAGVQCPDNDCGPRAVVDSHGRPSGFVTPQADALGNFRYRGSVWVRETSQTNITEVDENGRVIGSTTRGAEVAIGGHWRRISFAGNDNVSWLNVRLLGAETRRIEPFDGVNHAVLNVQTTLGVDACGGDTFQIRVDFKLPDDLSSWGGQAGANEDDRQETNVKLAADNRWQFSGDSWQFYDNGQTGSVVITLKRIKNAEGRNTGVYINIAGMTRTNPRLGSYKPFVSKALVNLVCNREK